MQSSDRWEQELRTEYSDTVTFTSDIEMVEDMQKYKYFKFTDYIHDESNCKRAVVYTSVFNKVKIDKNTDKIIFSGKRNELRLANPFLKCIKYTLTQGKDTIMEAVYFISLHGCSEMIPINAVNIKEY